MHVTIHTAQTWADTFISELNDTHVEAELRTKDVAPPVRLPCCRWCSAYSCVVCVRCVGNATGKEDTQYEA